MTRIQDVLDTIASVHKDANLDLVRKAYIMAASAHHGQVRLSGEPYLSHPLAVAQILAKMRFDEASVAAGLLHDTVEDSTISIDQVDAEFGEEVADIVDGVTKISQISFETKEEAQAENIRKMILAMANDIRVLIVKLADRLHNMRTLSFQKPHKQKLIAQETMDIYVPLANRLGLHLIKLELEDLSFAYLKPDIYAQITGWLETNQVVERRYIERVVERINEILEQNGVKADVQGRVKNNYSIYKKMTSQSLTLDDMHDIMAFRVIVDNLQDCYGVLGLMHAQWKPVHGRFKDYISMPKANGYQSLHTTVIGPDGERIEIQIRTREMHRLAEHGVASHWLYKEGGRVNPRDLEQFTWLREIFDRQSMESDSRDFMQSLRLDLFKDEVYIFTPRGDVKELPEGATPVDFAYLIHSQVGDTCAGAKVNGKLVPLATALKSGDTVEIITEASRKPSRDWLKFVKTAKARTRIQHYVRTEARDRAVAMGKEMLEKEGRRAGVNIQKAHKDGILDTLAAEFSLANVDDIFAAVGYGRFTPKKVILRVQAQLAPAETPPTPTPPEPPKGDPSAARRDSIHIQGVDNVLVRFAKCCNPLPGDPIIGYISRGRGVTVHTSDCPALAEMEPERLLPVYWDGQEDKPYPARIRIVAKNEKGVLASVASLLTDEGVNIDGANIHTSLDGRAEMDLIIEVRNAADLYRLLERLRALPPVLEVARASAS